MIIRGLDTNGDWLFGAGKSSYKKDLLALSQHIRTRLYEWKGDCFFDLDAGVDWYNRLNKRQEAEALRSEVRTVILKTDGVLEVNDLDFDFNSLSRKFTVRYAIKTIYSSQIVDNIEL